ncbi:hypothetical protein Syun_029392 [Stephania yunnanensis]|uniref:C2H2-type domain-containing protein n=1 Tax=Stephania yunnanensis TaxID=152371 RepID=A0AAP0HFZ5_9MAGN
MLPISMSNSTSLSEEAISASSCMNTNNNMFSEISLPQHPPKIKKKRNLPGNPDPDSEVIALSPKTLLATNRFICEICNKGFQRDQNLQLHRRGHNLPWKLKQRNNKDVIRKKVYVCPEPSCVHHHPSRALGDLTGIKKHFFRKHGEKKWKCEKCSKRYAVQSDYKAHSKTCGTREYKCDCGTIFSRKDSFITHRAFCDALAQESARLSTTQLTPPQIHHPSSDHHINQSSPFPNFHHNFPNPQTININSLCWEQTQPQNPNINPIHHNNSTSTTTTTSLLHQIIKPEVLQLPPPNITSSTSAPPFLLHHHHHQQQQLLMSTNNNTAHLSATALLEKAANVGAAAAALTSQTRSVGHMASSSSSMMINIAPHHDQDSYANTITNANTNSGFFSPSPPLASWQKDSGRLTRDFLGLTGDHDHDHQQPHQCSNFRDLLAFSSEAVDFSTSTFDRDRSIVMMNKPSAFGFSEAMASWGEIGGEHHHQGGQNIINS